MKAMTAQPVWTCRDGRRIRIKEMETSHVRNALAMLKRKGAIGLNTVRPYLVGPGPSGEGAQMTFEAEFDELLKHPITKFVDIFEAELTSRGEIA